MPFGLSIRLSWRTDSAYYDETFVKEHSPSRPDKIGRDIHHVGRAAGDEMLVNFIADAVKAGGQNAQKGYAPKLAAKPQ
jgi:hypothetical protein